MKTRSLVTVIIPTYNYGHYLARALDSVLNQSYANIEIIVVDDGSTDNTSAVMQAYAGQVVYIQQKNQGAAAARNRGLLAAQGDYICFLDADDMYHADNIAEKMAYLEKHAAVDWCYSNWAWVNDAGQEVMYGDEPEVSLAHIKAEGDVLALALQGYRLGTNVFMFRRTLVNRLQGFDVHLKVLEDYDYYLRAASLSPLGYIDKVLCLIYQHEGSLGTGCHKTVAYRNRWHMHKKIKSLFADVLLQPDVQASWRKQQADLYRNLATMMLASNHTRRASVFLRASLANDCRQWGALLLRWKIVWVRMKL
ncbi:MAG: glycosyltransferase [Mariprofundales bacterium]|nr:glycosyltransferase [Mariprofundales bacterium]